MAQNPAEAPARHEFVTLAGQRYACIRDVDHLEPFLMSIVSDSDAWLFVGSNSPFTAGRVDPDAAIFPYETVDKLLRHADGSGSLSAFRVRRGGSGLWLWGRGFPIPMRSRSPATSTSTSWVRTCSSRRSTMSWGFASPGASARARSSASSGMRSWKTSAPGRFGSTTSVGSRCCCRPAWARSRTLA